MCTHLFNYSSTLFPVHFTFDSFEITLKTLHLKLNLRMRVNPACFGTCQASLVASYLFTCLASALASRKPALTTGSLFTVQAGWHNPRSSVRKTGLT